MSSHHRQIGIHSPTVGKIMHYSALSTVMAAILLAGMPASAESTTNSKPAMTQSNGQPANEEKGLMTSSMRSTMPEGMYKASKLIGMEVKDRNGNSIGEIKNMALDPAQNEVRYAVLSFGGVMGIWDKLFAVPLNAFERGKDDNVLVLNVSKPQLDKIKGFDDDYWPTYVAGYWSGEQENASARNAQPPATGAVIKATEYLEREVNNLNGEELGEIKDLAIDLSSSRIKYVVIEHGGLLGVGEKLVAVPASTLSSSADNDEIFLNATEEELKNARGFPDDKWPVAATSIADIQYAPAGRERQAAGSGGMVQDSSQQQFSKLDADGNGYLSKSEVNRDPALEQRYNTLDKNRDGKLDRAEFARFELKTDSDPMRPMHDMNQEQGNTSK